MIFKFYLLLIIFIFPNFTENKIKIKTRKIRTKKEYHPFIINFDYHQLNTYKNKILVKKIREILNQTKNIFSQILNIKKNNVIKTWLGPDEFCDSKIITFNRKILKGIKADLLIYPILEKRIRKNLNETVLNKECAIDLETQRPIISKLSIDIELKLNKKKEMDLFFRDVIHAITHILGFHKIHLKAKGLLKSFSRIKFYSLNNINEKENNLWYPLKISLPNYDFSIRNDIMSTLRLRRILTFSSQTLAILQKLNWYQINLSLCDLSLKGDFYYLRHTISISIVKNKNNHYSLHCYLKNNLKKKCSVLNNTFIIKKIPKKINTNEYSNYFDGNHNLNRFLIWDKSIPKRKNPQIINLLSPKKNGKCKNPQRTVFLYYPKYLNLTNKNLEEYEIKPYEMKNENMTVYFTFIITRYFDHPPVVKVMYYNNITNNRNSFTTNYLHYAYNEEKLPEILGSFGKYQVTNTILNSTIFFDDKLILFYYYRKFSEKFPNDFDFHPESFINPDDKEIILQKFKNYTQKENDLWIYKPPLGLQGKGIKFMKSIDDFLNYKFISKYISNPHLLNNKKYHLRLYLVVTGVLPLKVYMHNRGQVMRALTNYSYNLNEVSRRTSMLTNTHANINQAGYNPNVTFDSEEGSHWSLDLLNNYITKRGGNWTKIWEKIKDIAFKTFLINYEQIQKRYLEEFKNLRSNNIAHRYGFDIMIDDNLRPWLLEVNSKPAMEFYNKINVYNKLQVEADHLTLIGMVPFDHNNQEPLDKEMIYKDKIDEAVQLSICEFERPNGGLERIFPVKETLNYYKQFIEYHDEYNKALWDFIENNEI